MSVQPIDCYDHIIGLYQGDCDCYDGRPEDFDTSDSGLYISDLLEPKMINGLLNCDQGASIWDLMVIVRNLAIRRFIGDTNALLMQFNRLRRQPFYGGIGRTKFTKTLSLTNGYYAGVRIFCANVVSGYLRIKGIGTLFNSTGVVNVTIYDSNGTSLGSYALNTVANKHELNPFPTTLELPLHDKYLDNIEYFILYQVNTANLPKNNDITCNCNKVKLYFNTAKPYWYDSRSNRVYGWTQYAMVGGIYKSALPNFQDVETLAEDKMYGLTLDMEFGCKVGEVFCKDSLDYDGNTLAQAMAIAIQHKAGVLFIDKIINTTNLNRTVVINREDLQEKRKEYQETYDKMVQYLAENVDLTTNDCMECKDIVEMIKTGIMA